MANDLPAWLGLAPISIETGYDLLTQDGVRRAKNKILYEEPDLLVLAFPCAPWSVLQHLQTPEVKAANRLRQARARPFLTFAREAAIHQLSSRKYFVLENQLRALPFGSLLSRSSSRIRELAL